MSGRALLALCGLAAGLGACVSAIPVPTPEDARVASARYGAVTVRQLEEGRTAYVKSCAGCHSLYEPSHLRADEWPAEVAEMGARGEVPRDDLTKIERYLVTMASRPRP